MRVRETAVKTVYLGVPVTINWYVLKGFALKTGLQFSFLTCAKDYSFTEVSRAGTDYKLFAESSIKDDLKKFDISLPIGLSYEFKVPIVLDLRYNIGLTKVFKGDGAPDMKNQVFMITGGYKFEL